MLRDRLACGALIGLVAFGLLCDLALGYAVSLGLDWMGGL